ncbi:MAG: ABC transporter permease [Solidesulfovibrio sp. DCME]|uniref:ABC transporter permease n=1 Tax=Solidesulfovibrio sp. DCME TaxID=3447380 RepID=UPI003D0D5799
MTGGRLGRLRPFAPQLGVTTLLVLLLAAFMALAPGTFLGARIYLSFLSTIPFATLLALGLTFCVVAGEMDLSFPSVMAVSGLAFALVSRQTASPALGLAAALAMGAAAGALNGFLVVRIGVPSIIATIGAQFFWRGAAIVAADGLAVNLADLRGTGLHGLLVGRLFGEIPAQSLWCLGLAVLFWFVLNRHVFGDALLFIGDNFQAARMMGIRTERTRLFLFIFMGMLAAFVSVCICLEMANWWPTQGEGYMLLVFASVFIGGTSVFGGKGTLYGTVVGSIIIGIIEAGIIAAGLAGFWTRLVYGLIILVSVSVHALALKHKRT